MQKEGKDLCMSAHLDMGTFAGEGLDSFAAYLLRNGFWPSSLWISTGTISVLVVYLH